MRTLRSKDMYVFPTMFPTMFPIESDIYAAMPWRRWWAPWRWALDVYMWEREPFRIAEAQTIATNITKAECIGLMKILGYPEEIK